MYIARVVSPRVVQQGGSEADRRALSSCAVAVVLLRGQSSMVLRLWSGCDTNLSQEAPMIDEMMNLRG
jgi:hypothetical protein